MDLSIQEIIVLSILSETERYGYEIDKIIETRQVRRWSGFALSSIYSVLSKLNRKGFVGYREVTQSGRPPRKLFSVSYAGQQALEGAVSELLLSGKQDIGRFDIILMIWSHLESERKLKLINGYYSKLVGRRTAYSEQMAGEINPLSSALYDRLISSIDSELDWLRRFALSNDIIISEKE